MTLTKKPNNPETEDGMIKKEVELIPHFVYSNNEHKMIGMIYLTDDQAYQLNKLMRYKGGNHQDIAFLRK